MTQEPNTELADVFIASFKGSNTPRILWRMPVRDAMKVCSDPSTSGRDWMLCWTRHNMQPLTGTLRDRDIFAPDDGRFDALLQRLCVQVIASRSMIEAGTVQPEWVTS